MNEVFAVIISLKTCVCEILIPPYLMADCLSKIFRYIMFPNLTLGI